jgi:methionyl aminopeptidase
MNSKKIALMTEGGHLLAGIRDTLGAAVKPGITPIEIEELAVKLINKTGGQASFKLVPHYHYATCINVNDSLVHGIPTAIPFKDSDLVSIDLGLYFKGFHTDTSTTVVAGKSTPQLDQLIAVGNKALRAGIQAAKLGNNISDISKAIEATITKSGYTPIHDLTGHGIGRHLHEEPYVPNYYDVHHHDSKLTLGQTLAIEPMITTGSHEIKLESDGWTLATKDGSLSILVEDTIAITASGPVILTK